MIVPMADRPARRNSSPMARGRDARDFRVLLYRIFAIDGDNIGRMADFCLFCCCLALSRKSGAELESC